MSDVSIFGTLAPNPGSNAPLARAKNLAGTYISVADTAARDALATSWAASPSPSDFLGSVVETRDSGVWHHLTAISPITWSTIVFTPPIVTCTNDGIVPQLGGQDKVLVQIGACPDGAAVWAKLVNANQNFGTPSAASDVAIKSYVDGHYTAGTGISVTSGVIATTGAFGSSNLSTSGSLTVSSLVSGVVHSSAGGLLSSSLVVDADIGDTTISPAKLASGSANAGQPLVWSGTAWAASDSFGARNLTTTGTFAIGASPASAGDLRVKDGFTIKGRNGTPGTGDVTLLDYEASAAGELRIGSNNSVNLATVRLQSGSTGITLDTNGSNRMWISGSFCRWFIGPLQFDVSVTSPSLSHTAATSPNSTGQPLTISSQGIGGTSSGTTIGGALSCNAGDNAASSTAQTGGKWSTRGGDCTGSAGTRTGGDWEARPGTGATADGELYLKNGGGTKTLRIGTVSGAPALAFFNVTPINQPSRVGQLADSTTGTPSTTIGDAGATYSQSALNNIHASLLAKINALETLIHNLGLSA